MKLEHKTWSEAGGWEGESSLGEQREPQAMKALSTKSAQLVLLFGARSVLLGGKWLADIKQAYPRAHLFGCSTAGEISGTRLYDDSLVSTAVHLEHSSLKFAQVVTKTANDSFEAGEHLTRSLPKKGLRHVFVLADGLHVNGSELTRGLLRNLPAGVAVTGGLAADGKRFGQTVVLAGQAPDDRTIGAIGFYGDRLRIGYGSLGGWDPFGPWRTITRSKGNVLYEFDGKPALKLYKTYLGEHAAGLPATGLHFPLSIQREDGEGTLVRTILAVDEETQSLTFAGDVPEGRVSQFMKANFERLIDGAQEAAMVSRRMIGLSPSADRFRSPRARSAPLDSVPAELAILISCVGRKLVLKQRTEEELEAVRNVLGERTVITGFYSYGEICPVAPNANCELHNQTMTITTFSEAG